MPRKRQQNVSGTGFLIQAICVTVCRHCSTSAQFNTKEAQFCWTKECNEVLEEVIDRGTYTSTHFDLKYSHFALETDASAGGLGAILQQDGHVIAYPSRVLG